MKRADPDRNSSTIGAVLCLSATTAFFSAGIVCLIVELAAAAAVLFLLSAGASGIAVYCFRTAVSKKRASGPAGADAEEPDPQEERLPMKHYRLRKG